MSGETRVFSRGSRMFRMPALLRRVFRWIPREFAARPRFPEERLTAPTMYFFSAMLACKSCAHLSKGECQWISSRKKNSRDESMFSRIKKNNFRAREKNKKNQVISVFRLSFLGDRAPRTYLSSTSSPTSIRRNESVRRAIAQRSPTRSTAASPRYVRGTVTPAGGGTFTQ